MTKTDKATAIIKLLKKGYSPKEINKRIGVSYNYAWKLKRDLEAAVEDIKTTTLSASSDFLESLSQGKGKPKPGEYVEVDGAKNAQEIDAILNQRATTYGRFVDVSEIAQEIKATIRIGDTNRSEELPADQIEALEMIASKIGRILCGDSSYVDSWVDIAGYAQLVVDRLQGKAR